jgi:hypothetical protein
MRFQKGNNYSNGTGGRPIGSRNRLQRKFVDALTADFEEHGEAAIRVVRHESPETYLKIIAATIPRELSAETTPITELGADELQQMIAMCRELIARQEQPQLAEVKTITDGRAN